MVTKPARPTSSTAVKRAGQRPNPSFRTPQPCPRTHRVRTGSCASEVRRAGCGRPSNVQARSRNRYATACGRPGLWSLCDPCRTASRAGQGPALPDAQRTPDAHDHKAETICRNACNVADVPARSLTRSNIRWTVDPHPPNWPLNWEDAQGSSVNRWMSGPILPVDHAIRERCRPLYSGEH
jgi:hypothetical protein